MFVNGAQVGEPMSSGGDSLTESLMQLYGDGEDGKELGKGLCD